MFESVLSVRIRLYCTVEPVFEEFFWLRNDLPFRLPVLRVSRFFGNSIQELGVTHAAQRWLPSRVFFGNLESLFLLQFTEDK